MLVDYMFAVSNLNGIELHFCGYCHEEVASIDYNAGERMYHCATCQAEGKGFNPEAEHTLHPCGHVFRASGDKAFVMNP